MPRARELANRRPSEPTLRELRQRFGGAGVDDDELLLRYLAGEDDVAAMRTGKPESFGPHHPLASLLGQMGQWPQCSLVRLEKDGLKLTLAKRQA